MKNPYIRIPITLLGTRCLSVVLSLFLTAALGWLTDVAHGPVYYSLFIMLIILPMLYGECARAAIADKKPYSKNQPYLAKGLLLGLLAEIPAFIMVMLVYLSAFKVIPSFSVFNIVYRIWMAPFLGFLSEPLLSEPIDLTMDMIKKGLVTPELLRQDVLSVPINYLLITVIIPCTTALGYIAGYFNITILEKILPSIVYKKPRKRK